MQAIALVILTRGPAERAAFLLVVEDDVDHAGNGVGAILRGGAVLQHLDTLDRALGDEVEIGSDRPWKPLGRSWNIAVP